MCTVDFLCRTQTFSSIWLCMMRTSWRILFTWPWRSRDLTSAAAWQTSTASWVLRARLSLKVPSVYNLFIFASSWRVYSNHFLCTLIMDVENWRLGQELQKWFSFFKTISGKWYNEQKYKEFTSEIFLFIKSTTANFSYSSICLYYHSPTLTEVQ